ncbi:glutathione S-transferase [Roseibium sp. MMSF_3544]|uniref:glutathione S-transferase n=1 Tax=unclassified Roseibium TaxID=2629323 RepID=UPI0027402216|nr:glutathione S-transferase [Roseibium sp. MMSF_3544]
MSRFPILYSFRRCPYAIRARLAIAASGQVVEMREIVLRDKAPEFLETSPSATVPCLKLEEAVLDESLDIMIWALERADPDAWLSPEQGRREDMLALIERCDGPFKTHLDRYKYHTRYQGADRVQERSAASEFLSDLNERLEGRPWLFGSRASLADFAILPFVRQFANSDRDWFDRESWTNLNRWLQTFESSDRFQKVMPKWEKWQAGSETVLFPA